MTGIAGNAVTLAIGKQAAKGTPQTTPAFKLRLTGGDVSPDTAIVQLAETDASRQAGSSVVVGSTVGGSTSHYLRPDEFGMIAYAALGANADSGSTNFTHTATPAASAPYLTLFKAYNVTTLVDQYSDCRITSLGVSGAAGGVLTYSPTWAGLNFLLGATDPALAATTTAPLTYPQVTVTKGGAAPGTVESFDLTISNGGAFVTGDSGLVNPDYVFGQFSVSGTITLLFENDQDYRAFHTGSTTGTAPSTTIFSESLSIAATKDTNTSVTFTMAGVEYTAYPLAPDVSGAPLRVAMAFRTQRQAAIASNLTIVTKNATPSY